MWCDLPSQGSVKNFGANNQSLLVATRTNELLGNSQGIGKSTAHRLDIESHGTLISQFCLQQAGRAWEDEVRSRGRKDYQVELPGIRSRCGKRATAGFER